MNRLQNGQTLIELLVALALTAAILPALTTGLITSRQGKPQNDRRQEAYHLMREATEVVKIIRDSSWSAVETNGTYHPTRSGSTWTLASGSEIINDITREIVIGDVYRDQNQLIVESGGTIDPSSKKISINLGWTEPIGSYLSSSFYITRFNDNAVYLQTTEADFQTGTHNGTVVTNTGDGEVILGAGGSGNWCAPQSNIVGEFDLPGDGNSKDVMAKEGKALTGTHETSGGTFLGLNISNDNPPQTTVIFSLPGYETNDVFFKDGFGYFATENTSKDVIIVRLSTGQEVGYFNDTDWFGTAQGVTVHGDVGFVTIGFKLHSFDLSSKFGSRPQIDSESLGLLATGYRLQAKNEHAYVALDFGAQEMGIYNVIHNGIPGQIIKTGYADVNGASGKEVFINQQELRAYLATSQSGSQDEFFIIDITGDTGNRPVLGSYDSGTMDPTGVTLATFNKAILVGTGGEEYQVIDISDEQNPVRCGGIDVDEGIWGVSAVLEDDNEAYSYIMTRDPNAEFKIIIGGPGGSYASEGYYESAPFDANYSTAFNRIIPTDLTPVSTSATYQIAIVDALNNNCNDPTYTFVGPDGTDQTFYTSESSLLLDDNGSGFENPGRCMKYRVYLSTEDSASTPIMEEMEINYAP